VQKIKSQSEKNDQEPHNSLTSPEMSTLRQQISQQNVQKNNLDNEIDLSVLMRAIWSEKIIIMFITFIFTISSIVFALSKSDIYKATVLLAPASSDSAGGIGALAGQFGGLASLAGISLGSGGADKTALALQILKSRAFLEAFIIKHDLLLPLMAGDDWDRVNNVLLFNDEDYDLTNNKWIRDVSFPKTVIPSKWEAYQELLNIISTSQDKSTSLVTINVEFYSPQLAKKWLGWLVADVNDTMRDTDEREAQASITYLTKQLENTEVSAMETVFYQLIEEQTKNMMLTKVSAEYVLKTIDPAQVPEQKEGPERLLIIVLGTLLGCLSSLLIVLVRYLTISSYLVESESGI
jgi:uncharacterized protein involved in exopolysaccharide biosynthesis